MYLPHHFTIENRTQIDAIIERNSFATLVVAGEGGLDATHLPLLFDPRHGDNGTVTGHVARANAQWQRFDGRTAALAIFARPHGYISPSWYRDTRAVPTWDYVVVHAHGCPRIVDDERIALAMLRELVERHEAGLEPAWSLDSLDGDRVRRLAKGVVAFEMPVERLEAKAKLGQNRAADQPGVVDRLEARGNLDLAALIRAANGFE